MVKISVILLTRNSQKHLVKCIDSILMQKYSDFEVIVIDSYSTDNTLNILNSYNNCKYYNQKIIKIILSEKDLSVGLARKIGADNAIGEILAYIDSDVELPYENWLENMAKPLLEGYKLTGNYIPKEQIAGVQTLAKCRDSDPQVLKRVHARFEYKYDVIDMEHYQPVGTSHLLLRKHALEEVGGFKDVFSDEDIEVMNSIMKLGYKFIYLKEEKCYHHHVDTYLNHIRRELRGLKNRIKTRILR